MHLLLVRLLHALALGFRGNVAVGGLGDAEGEADDAGDEAEAWLSSACKGESVEEG